MALAWVVPVVEEEGNRLGLITASMFSSITDDLLILVDDGYVDDEAGVNSTLCLGKMGAASPPQRLDDDAAGTQSDRTIGMLSPLLVVALFAMVGLLISIMSGLVSACIVLLSLFDFMV